jgi:hypothetical protein
MNQNPLSIDVLETRTLFTTVIGLAAANQLVVFDSAAPAVIVASRTVAMPKGETLIGVEFDYLAQLYGLSDANRIYRIDPETGIATAASDATIPDTSGDRLSFDIDLHNPDPSFRAVGTGGTQFAGPLRSPAKVSAVAYAPDDVNAGRTPNLVSIASKSGGGFPGPVTLYAIDANTDSLVTIGTIDGTRRSADTGRLYTIASLGFDATDSTTLDIAGGVANPAACLTISNKHGTRFFTFDVATGLGDGGGTIGDATVRVSDVALYPEASPSATILGLTTGNAILAFSSERPSVILGRTAITGLRADESMISVDSRPGYHQTFGVSSRDELYLIDTSTGAATPVGPRFTPFFKGAPAAADFDPVARSLNVISNLGEALRLDPNTGAVIDARPHVRGIQIDAPIAYAPADSNAAATPNVFTFAHDNNKTTAGGTTLFGIDPITHAIVAFDSSGSNQLTTGANIGALIDDIASLDILHTISGDIAYLAARTPSQRPVTLFQIDLQTGAKQGLGDIASGKKPVRDIAVVTG